ncbi:M15 family metallopeptidase [Lacinutrix sp. 5H-3-7-4]|uniref:M15 family metallopeptidase n=1 Tax=Lacinutrix sp. (strain 5H-3-7-4) TaxID=983544 RepID=UPI00020A370A|nr:M15 family metallopeptidase [Lacinutrix sp. 5H-3-7-4]AEH00346.1 peptidase M15B and M15C DD-carboxypeptidase VanY/endolysin [Lacinutrix sp. 5H-3-7-4]
MIKKKDIKLIVILILACITFPQLTNSQSLISVEELIGKGNPKLFGEGYKLRKEAYIAFKKMQTAALKSNIKIGAVSSYRSYAHQKRIWERKFKRNSSADLSPKDNVKKIIEYSTIPGTSRHHWGTDIDIYQTNVKQPNGILQPKNYHGNGVFCKLKEWMDANSKQFGFYLVYTDKVDRKGFKYEPWHYSYKPLSKTYLKAYKKINVSELLKKDKLLGSDNFSEAFINQYTKENILDINPELL